MGCSIPITCDGCDHAPRIGENGNWYVGDTDTGVRVQGADGPAGPQGPKGDSGIMEEIYSTSATRIGTWVVDAVPNSQLGIFNRIVRLYGAITSAGNTMSFPHSRFTAFYDPRVIQVGQSASGM